MVNIYSVPYTRLKLMLRIIGNKITITLVGPRAYSSELIPENQEFFQEFSEFFR